MTKCKDGRKHIIVKEYEKKDGAMISRHERSCPKSKSDLDIETYICCICGEECGLDDTYEFEVKGQSKQICKECADTVHGLV